MQIWIAGIVGVIAVIAAVALYQPDQCVGAKPGPTLGGVFKLYGC